MSKIKCLFLYLLIFTFNLFASDIPQVFVASAKKSALVEHSVYPAVVKSRVYSQVTPQINAIIEKVLVPLGTRVLKGQKILKIINQDRSLSYKASYIEAPVNGIISWIGVNSGSFINAQGPAFIITDPEKLYVRMDVPIKSAYKLKNGKQGTIITDSDALKASVKVLGVGGLADNMTGTLPVELSLTVVSDEKLYPGQIVKIKFDFSSEPLILVKDSAVKMVGNQHFIQLVENDAVKKVNVKLGKKIDGMAVVLSGLNEGQVFVERSSSYIADGDKVKIVEKM